MFDLTALTPQSGVQLRAQLSLNLTCKLVAFCAAKAITGNDIDSQKHTPQDTVPDM